MKGRVPAMLLIFAAVVALVLNSRGKLIGPGSVSDILFRSDPPDSATLDRIGTFALAFFGYLLAISFLNESETAWITGVIVLGALYFNAVNAPKRGQVPVLTAVFGGGRSGSSSVTAANPFGSGMSVEPDPSPGGN